jgi:transglutaminase-like putative cysteine protease
MMQSIARRLFHIPEMIILLSLIALACLPIALSNLVRDAGLSLLLPFTLSGTLLAWLLTAQNVRKTSSLIVLLGVGPLILFMRIGQLGGSVIEILKQAALFPINWIRFQSAVDISPLLNASQGLSQQLAAVTQRLNLWFTGLTHGIQVEDPVVRTLIWSLALWLTAVWAGWQIFRNKRLLAGMLPSTIILAFVLDYTGRQMQILWLHLVLLLFLYGLSSYANLQTRWQQGHTDYADSTGTDTLGFAGALSIGLVALSFLSSTISVRDILDDLRDRTQKSSTAQAESLGLESVQESFRAMGFGDGLPRSYMITAGEELSKHLAMTIVTGDLPPMPESARPVVPRYYWRTLTYQTYTGSGWTNPQTSAEQIESEQPLFELPSSNYRIVNQQVTYPNDTVERLYWTGTLVRADVPFQVSWVRKPEGDPLLDGDMLAALAPVETYTAESLLLQVNANQLRASPAVYPDWVRAQFLTLPDSVPERVRALARDLTATGPTPYDRAIAIQNYLREFPYTLEVGAPPTGRDVADYFLFDLKQGYCDYYATTMVVLARAAGLPARLVVGYASGLYEAEKAHYIVTENYAHSWVEVYFADIGWVEFEPTSSQPAILYAEEGQVLTPAEVAEPAPPIAQQFTLFLQRLNFMTPALILGFSLIAWFAWDTLHLAWLDPVRGMQVIYKRLRRLARPLSGPGLVNQTAHQYASALDQHLAGLATRPRLAGWLSPSSGELHQLTDLYTQSLFAPSPLTRTDVRSALRTWTRLRFRLLLANLAALTRPRRETVAVAASSSPRDRAQ